MASPSPSGPGGLEVAITVATRQAELDTTAAGRRRPMKSPSMEAGHRWGLDPNSRESGTSGYSGSKPGESRGQAGLVGIHALSGAPGERGSLRQDTQSPLFSGRRATSSDVAHRCSAE